MAGTRYKVAAAADLEDGERVIEEIDGLEVAVFNVDGEFYAVANFCPHQAGPLCEGLLMGRIRGADGWRLEYDDTESVIACPWHGWRFDVTTGRNLQSERYAVPTYDVEVENGDVYVLR